MHDGSEIGMRGQDEFCVAAGGADGGRGEAALGACRAGEYKFAITESDAMELGRIVEREEATIEAAAGGEFFHDRGDVAAGALHAAGSVEFRKEADEHGVSLPSAGTERKVNAS